MGPAGRGQPGHLGRPAAADRGPRPGRLWARQEPALEDLPVAEIARVLGCAEGTVKAHLHHGRAALGRRLALFEERAP
jgi:Sigma-70, region 4